MPLSLSDSESEDSVQGFMIHLTVLKTFQVVNLQVLMIQFLMSFLSLCTKWNTLPILPALVDVDVELAEVVGTSLAELRAQSSELRGCGHGLSRGHWRGRGHVVRNQILSALSTSTSKDQLSRAATAISLVDDQFVSAPTFNLNRKPRAPSFTQY